MLLMILCILPFSLHNGQYGFTPDMAAGSYADRTFFDIDDYQIYYFTFEGNFDDGRHWSDLQGWKLIKKHFWGCLEQTEANPFDYESRANKCFATKKNGNALKMK